MKKKKEAKSIKRIKKIKINKNSDLIPYFEATCSRGKDLYNAMNYYCRQVYFYSDNTKNGKEVKPETLTAFNEITDCIKAINDERSRKDKKLFKTPEVGKWMMPYELLDPLARMLCESKYRNLPSHVSQHVLKVLNSSWKSFVGILSAIKNGTEIENPKPPKYTRKLERPIKMSTSNAKFKEDENGSRYLWFSKLPEDSRDMPSPIFHHKWFDEIPENWRHTETSIIPTVDGYYLSLTFDIPFDVNIPNASQASRIIGIDPGLTYFTAIANNFGERPVIINGKPISNVNDFWNAKYSEYKSILEHGHDSKHAQHTSKRIERSTKKRNNRIDDYMHKVSRWIIEYCLANDVDTIVVGKNIGWKQNINMGRKNNRKFVQIPHAKFIQKLTYKANEAGINVIEQPEAYTSKASFLDLDPIPDYDSDTKGTYIFSGTRKERGLYIASDGTKVHADVNGALNIIRKAFPDKEVDEAWRSVALLSPIKVNI